MTFSYRRNGLQEAHASTNPALLVTAPWRHRGLIYELAKRDVLGRYRGSVMGLAWSVAQPLLMLAIYTTVFGTFLKAKWPGTQNSLQFAVVLFAGLIIFNFFAECLNRAPTLVTSNANYVTKLVFPLEILPWVTIASAGFHFLTSLAVWIAFALAIYGGVGWTIVLLPIVLAPLVAVAVGLCWFIGATGVYLRDLGYVTGLLTTILLFLSPVFYAVDGLPPEFRALVLLNPLTFIVEQARAVMIDARLPDFGGLLAYGGCSLLVAWAGLAWFQKTREGFADVL